MGQDLTIIDASATKDFFISILVRDIDLAEAIVDLVDNSVDGARKLRGGNDLSNLYVQLDLSGNRFSITDNCGGIEAVVARKYAFRFGRDTNDPPPMTKHTVGQFGVGMKRAIFKLGNNIEIKSSAKNSIFTVNLNVAAWKQKPEWDLTFNTLQENLTQTEENLGTSIVITELNEGPSQEIVLGSFHTKLKNMIESAHAESINKGFEIKIGVHTLSGLHPKMIRSAEIVPLNKTVSYFEKSNTPVTVRIYAGVSDSGPAEAGWYVICNGRTILAANQDSTTGWGDGTPRFHNQYSRFRGYIYFDCDDAGLLPWNTTKTDVDAELPIYQAARLEMVNSMKPILEFLNKVDREKDTEETPLTDAIQSAAKVLLQNLTVSPNFVCKVDSTKKKAKLTRIQYQRPSEKVDEVKRILNASSLKEVGEKTFDYFLNMECDQ